MCLVPVMLLAVECSGSCVHKHQWDVEACPRVISTTISTVWCFSSSTCYNRESSSASTSTPTSNSLKVALQVPLTAPNRPPLHRVQGPSGIDGTQPVRHCALHNPPSAVPLHLFAGHTALAGALGGAITQPALQRQHRFGHQAGVHTSNTSRSCAISLHTCLGQGKLIHTSM